MKTVFVFAYYSYDDPVFQSAVLPYLQSQKNIKFIVLTWEQRKYILPAEEIRKVKATLALQNIIWKRAYWHSGSMKFIKKIYDFCLGLFFSLFLIIRYKASGIYTEAFPGAIIGFVISILSRKPHIIHTFEPHADYMLEAGVWNRTSWEYRLLKRLEIIIARQAHTIITATHAYAAMLKRENVTSNIVVLPSCIDLDFYKFLPVERTSVRRRLGINDNQIAICYLGKLGGMYMEEEIFELFHACQNHDADRFFFLLFTNADTDLITALVDKYKIDKDKTVVKYLSKDEVPEYLSASDMGFVAVRPNPSKFYCSPIKTGEYLACGLPVILPEGISDDYNEITRLNLGVVYPVSQSLNMVAANLSEYCQNLDRQLMIESGQKYTAQTRNLATARVKLAEIFHNLP